MNPKMNPKLLMTGRQFLMGTVIAALLAVNAPVTVFAKPEAGNPDTSAGSKDPKYPDPRPDGGYECESEGAVDPNEEVPVDCAGKNKIGKGGKDGEEIDEEEI